LMKVWQKLYQQPWANPTWWETPKSDDWVVDWEVETDWNTTRV
jgi:hypothetical protein